MSEGTHKNLVAPAGLYTPLALSTPQDFSAWPFKSWVFDPAAPAVALDEIAITVDYTNRQIIPSLPEADAQALIPEGATEVDLAYIVYAKPAGAVVVRAFYGSLKILLAGPPSGIA
jgi:hypothetical protein